MWQWKAESGGRIVEQLKRMGASCDWERERFTMDEGLSRAVREIFVRMYEDGLIYRGDRMVDWDPVTQTVLSKLEVLTSKDGEKGHFWYLKYPLADGSGHIIVGTTRPETMLGDTAVAVHPDDRYQNLIGKEILLPIVGRRIPIIADTILPDPEGNGGGQSYPSPRPERLRMRKAARPRRSHWPRRHDDGILPRRICWTRSMMRERKSSPRSKN